MYSTRNLTKRVMNACIGPLLAASLVSCAPHIDDNHLKPKDHSRIPELQEIIKEDGRYTLLILESDRCPYSVRASPYHDELVKKLEGSDTKVVRVDLRPDTFKAIYLEKLGLAYKDDHGVSMPRNGHKYSVPSYWVLDPDKKLIGLFVGYTELEGCNQLDHIIGHYRDIREKRK